MLRRVKKQCSRMLLWLLSIHTWLIYSLATSSTAKSATGSAVLTPPRLACMPRGKHAMARGETHILVGPSVASEYRYQVTVECRAPLHCAARGYRYRTANLYHDEWFSGACITASNLGCRLDYRCMAQRKHMSSEVCVQFWHQSFY